GHVQSRKLCKKNRQHAANSVGASRRPATPATLAALVSEVSTLNHPMHPTKDDCYTTSVKYCACIEFHFDERHRHGFHTSQLIDYTLEPNPDAGENKSAPP